MEVEDLEIKIGPLLIRVLGREFPDKRGFWDGNWLQVEAECSGAGSRVRVSGSLLRNEELARFASQCAEMHSSLSGTAVLRPLEPDLRVELRFTDGAGHIELIVSITGNQLVEAHQFKEMIDQSYLPQIVSQCKRIVSEFPVRGKPE
jgi:hypothetical protein